MTPLETLRDVARELRDLSSLFGSSVAVSAIFIGKSSRIDTATTALAEELRVAREDLEDEKQVWQDYANTIRLNIPAEFTKQPQLDLCMQRMKERIFTDDKQISALREERDEAIAALRDVCGMCHCKLMEMRTRVAEEHEWRR